MYSSLSKCHDMSTSERHVFPCTLFIEFPLQNMFFTFGETKTIFGVMKTQPKFQTYSKKMESWMIPPFALRNCTQTPQEFPRTKNSSMRFICSRIRSLKPLPACTGGSKNDGKMNYPHGLIWFTMVNNMVL